jgi:hypothetical protein
MKKLFTLFCFLLLFSAGCTEDGKDGSAYISIDWEYINNDNKVSSYDDDNPATPETVNAGTYYLTEPGTYYYTYVSEDYSYYYNHSGSYTIYINEGSDKTLFKDGTDGEDLYFDIYLTIYKRKGDEKGFVTDARNETVKLRGGYMEINESVLITPKKTDE